MPDAYGIKDGYRTNPPRSARRDPGSYWTPRRIALAGHFQFYVYRRAAALAAERGLRSALDAGCGAPKKARELLAPAFETVWLADRPEVADLAARLAPALDFRAVDLAAPPDDLGRRFDVVVCADVVEHLGDPDPCLAFLRRHVAPGGVVVLSTPERDRLRGPHCAASGQREHVREWNAAEFRRYVESRGLAVEEQSFHPAIRLPALVHWYGRRRGLAGRRFGACQLVVCRVR